MAIVRADGLYDNRWECVTHPLPSRLDRSLAMAPGAVVIPSSIGMRAALMASDNTPVQGTRRLALRIAYLGTRFAGWQVQLRQRTVQGELEEALGRLFGVAVKLYGAGRTDAGVHAAGQVAHCDVPGNIPPQGVRAALNNRLPEDLRVIEVWSVDDGFDARRWALAKTYCYRLAWGPPLAPWESARTWLIDTALDPARIRTAAGMLRGDHDFRAFALSGHSGTGERGTRRRITEIRTVRHGRRLTFTVTGDGFLRGMARRIAGALVEVGRGALPSSWIQELLLRPDTSPPAPTAPAHGLTMERVVYPRHRRTRS